VIEKIEVNSAVRAVKEYLHHLQNRICAMVEIEDGHIQFIEEAWSHNAGGGGLTRSFADGKIIEKAGVNFSHVKGFQLPPAATKKRPDLVNCQFQALGVSVVIHPLNPNVPTSHLNVRFIIAEKPDQGPIWWFGGGFDLTPYYGFEEDCIHWHKIAKAACDPFGEDYYPRYKKSCDEYFYLPHRQEARGVGGIFFDDMNEKSFEHAFAFMRSVGDSYLEAYQPIIAKRKNTPFTEQQRDFQCYRRGRYVEFNLLYDRGTLFGLQSGGRTESILMSLPPHTCWKYNWQPEINSEEAKLYTHFLPAKNWLAN